MDTDDSQTWTIGGINKNYRNDYFRKENSAAESSDYSKFNDSPGPKKSRAALILAEVAEQLEANETEYNTMKDRFDYCKMLYHGCGMNSSEIADSIKLVDKPQINTATSSPRDSIPNSPLDDDKDFEDHVASGETEYYDFYTDAKRDKAESTDQSPKYSGRSYKVSPRQDIYLGGQDENSSDSGPQKSFSEVASLEGKTFVREETSENAVVDDDFQIRRDHEFSDISTSHQHPYQLNLAEYSKSIHEENFREAETLPEQDQEISLSDILRSARNQAENKEEFLLNLSGSMQSVPMKNKKSRSEKYRRANGSVTSTSKKNGVKQQVDDTVCGVSKIRRKKRRLKASNSRSTTATRDTCFPDENKKDTRKRKPRGHATLPASQSSQHRHEISTKIQQNWSEVVEIYHNSALKSGSLSVVSSKHSRLDPRGRNAVNANTYDQRSLMKDHHQLAENNQQSKRNTNDTEIRRTLKSQKNNRIDISEDNRTHLKISHQVLQGDTDLRSGEPNRTKLNYKTECPTIQNDNKIPEECNDDQPHHRNSESRERPSAYYDPLAIRNYELPTVASKMKRVNRSYFNRFNFRNIPFVVGTSVTPSYNLGLNIQETLSLIKTRQTMPGGVTPLLISKVSKGVRPVSTLLGSIGNKDEMSVEDSGIRFDVTSARICNYYPEQMNVGSRTATTVQLGPFSLHTPRLGCIPASQQLFENQQTGAKVIEVSTGKKPKTQSICSSMKLHSRKNAESHLQLTPSALLRQRQEELNMGMPQNTNGIREVLMNYHDQFEAMNMKYEKLREEAEKSNDESLKKEKAILEKELTSKEEEINAVLNLYKEVMALKQQMKQLHEKNSLVCVATESPGSPMYPQISSRAQTANPMFNIYRRSGSGNARGPSTSTRLAGLLRQIKKFQNQLKSAS